MDIDRELIRRQAGKGRGGRMKIEHDRAEILSGVRWGMTLGSPIALMIENRDWPNWQEAMSPFKEHEGSIGPLTRPRPGHADLAGALKYNVEDIRDILERSSARETAMRVGLGAVAKKFLSEFDIKTGGFVTGIGGVEGPNPGAEEAASERYLLSMAKKAEVSNTRCPDERAAKKMETLIERAAKEGTTLGGVFLTFIVGAPPGLGAHIQWDRRLSALLSSAVMSIQAVKGVELGSGFAMGRAMGRDVMDEIYYKGGRFFRKTNHAGGLEGGITNGMPVVLRAAMKPIPTQKRPLKTVDLRTKKAVSASYERSDVCAVPAASVIAEAMVALAVASAFLEKFGGDGIAETKRNHASYLECLKGF
jgi:chorismate synthase